MLLKFLSEILYTEINCSVNARNIFYSLILQLIYLNIILEPKPVCSLKIKSFHVVLTSMLGLLRKLSESSLCNDSFYCLITFTNYPLGEWRRGHVEHLSGDYEFKSTYMQLTPDDVRIDFAFSATPDH